MGGGFFVVYLVNEMGVVQTKETRRTAVASTPPAPLPSTATAAPVPHHTPPSSPALVGVELAEMAKRDGHAVADTGTASGIDAVAEGVVPGSEVNGGVGEDGRDQGGTEVEGDGEDDGDRSESSGEGNELEVEAIPVGKKERTAKVRTLHPRRPGQPDCAFYVESGYCKFKADCKFNHPPNRRGRKGKCKKQPDALQVAEKEKDVAQQSVSQAEYERKHRKQHDASQVPEKEKYAVQPNMTQGVHEKASEMIGNLKERDKRIKYPQRPDAIDCSFYMKTGECKFGSACIFNHPSDRKHNKDVKEKLKEASSKRFGQKEKDVKEKLKETPTKSFGQKGKDVKEKLKEAYPKSFGEMEKDAKKKLKEASSKSFGQKEKTYTTPGACKISKQSNDHGVKEASSVALNFLNLPIRPGAEECSEYMREGSCKFGINCRHHHPDPTATNTPDLPSQYEDSRLTQQFENGSGVSPSLGTSWHASTSYTTGMHLPYVLYPNPEWNGYQVPMPQPEIHIRNPSAFPVNHAGNNANMIMHQQAHIDYPERPGQPECHYFKKTGACKFRSVRKFHHPKDQLGRNTNSSSEPKQISRL